MYITSIRFIYKCKFNSPLNRIALNKLLGNISEGNPGNYFYAIFRSCGFMLFSRPVSYAIFLYKNLRLESLL